MASVAERDEKIALVMREFAAGRLHSSSGALVTDPKQAQAIALSEARRLKRNAAMTAKKARKTTARKPSPKKAAAKQRGHARALERLDESIAKAKRSLKSAEERATKLKNEIRELDQIATGTLNEQLAGLGYRSEQLTAQSGKVRKNVRGVYRRKGGKKVFEGSAHEVRSWLKTKHPGFAAKAAQKRGRKHEALVRTKETIERTRGRLDRLSKQRGASLRRANGE